MIMQIDNENPEGYGHIKECVEVCVEIGDGIVDFCMDRSLEDATYPKVIKHIHQVSMTSDDDCYVSLCCCN